MSPSLIIFRPVTTVVSLCYLSSVVSLLPLSPTDCSCWAELSTNT